MTHNALQSAKLASPFISSEATDCLIAAASNRPSSHSTVEFWQMGGAVNRTSADESAFGGLHAPYLLGVEANWEDLHADEVNIAWTRKCIEDMQPFSDGSEYLNFPGFMEKGEETLRKTFGNGYERLVALKNKWDPANLFQLNANIKPTMS